jgi:hypothetical protein
MHYYLSEEDRQTAIAAGEASTRMSTVSDGHKHYAVIRYSDAGQAGWTRDVERNLTWTPQDTLPAAEALAARLNHGPFGPGTVGYAAERIA